MSYTTISGSGDDSRFWKLVKEKGVDKEQKAIDRIRVASEMSLKYYGLPLVCTYSGGKDSDVMLELFKRSGIPFEIHHSHTTADVPPTVYHIRKKFRELELDGIECNIDYHKQADGSAVTMWNLIPKKLMPPTRRVRYCCSNRMIATGVRWAESNSRKNREPFEAIGHTQKEGIFISDEKMLITDNDDTRRLFERCQLKAKTVTNPIIDWEDCEIWEYYWNECKSHNPLYEMGYYRVGCIGCPMSGKARYKEFYDFPRYKQMYIKAFDRMLQVREAKGLRTEWKRGEEVFLWWMEDDSVPGQMDFENFPEILPEVN